MFLRSLMFHQGLLVSPVSHGDADPYTDTEMSTPTLPFLIFHLYFLSLYPSSCLLKEFLVLILKFTISFFGYIHSAIQFIFIFNKSYF